MKKLLVIVFLIMGFIEAEGAGLERVTVVPVAGRVFWRSSSKESWQKIGGRTVVNINSEVSTASESRGIVIFNQDKTNVVEIGPNSRIKISSLYKIYLYQGEALALIRKLKKGKNFEIQTPTAVSGARGTAWFSRYSSGRNHLGCLEDKIYVRGLDENGNPTGEEELEEGFGMDVGIGGMFGNRYELPPEEQGKLNKIRQDLGSFSQGESSGSDEEEDLEEDSGLGEAREEASDNWRDSNDESEREEREGSSPGSSSPGGGGDYELGV